MNLQNKNLFVSVFVLLAFISIGVLGLLQFNHINHSTEIPMTNCPYAENGFSICENTFDHINKWHQFFNVITPSLFIFLLLILGIVLYFFGKQNFLNQKQYFYKWKYRLYDKKSCIYQEKVIKWLALFENSPSSFHRTQLIILS